MKYLLEENEIKQLTDKKGYCIASNEITISGKKIGYMYREESDLKDDSGWRFFAGDEDEKYCQEAENFAIFDINTLCNYDIGIIKFLDLPYGSVVEMNDKGRLERVK